jgi:hypothetical protein
VDEKKYTVFLLKFGSWAILTISQI